jgi:hypothetical protein
MCSRVNCRKCGKVTYSGCGQHLDQVFAGVPKDQRCDCANKASTTGDNPSLLGKIFGR